MGRTPIRSDPEISIYPLGNQANMPEYRKNLAQVFGEEFLAEATLKDKQLAPLIKNIQRQRLEHNENRQPLPLLP